MAISDQVKAPGSPADKAVTAWYALSGDEVTARLGVDPTAGLAAARAAELLAKNGPNALPVEKPPSAIGRFLAEFTSYMQIILVGAAVVSLVIQQWATAIVLIVITLFNALVGLRQQGKAESAMNALQSMMKATARVRRDGAEAQIPAEQVVVGDIVLIAAGDEVPADGRIVTSSALQIDESALTGESVPAAKDAETLSGGGIGPGEQSNMAFMHTPVTHGSGVLVVTGTGSDTQVGKIAHMLTSTAKEETPLTRQMNTLTLWIVGAAGVTMVVMFALGLARGQSLKTLFDTAVALAIAAIPLALPMVVQVVLSLGSVELAEQKAIVKDLPSVETLGFTSAVNSDKTGTLTMNQMTAVEVVDPTDRYAITGTGYGLEGKIIHPAGKTDTLDGAILPYVMASDAKLVDGKVVGDPTEGALLVLAHKAGVFIDATREQLPRLNIPGEAILGADFAALSEAERLDRIDRIGVVGRVAPEHKVLLAETLKKKGDVVAMTGDGVNDAPAIKAADIGVAMGSGTEVAKNAGRMILSDDNFATIIYAVEQGRKLYDNLSKYIRFVLLELVAFVLTFLGATLFNIAAGQPFTPAQILWINFLVNAPFGVALGFDKQTPGLMSRRPRPRGEPILTRGVMITCGLVGLFIAVANLALIATGKNHYGSVKTGQSMGLVAFSLMLVVAAFEARSETTTAFDTDIFNSSKMNTIAAAEVAGTFLITQANFMNRLLGTNQLTAAQWGFAFLAAVVLLLGWEAGKWIARRRARAGRVTVTAPMTRAHS